MNDDKFMASVKIATAAEIVIGAISLALNNEKVVLNQNEYIAEIIRMIVEESNVKE